MAISFNTSAGSDSASSQPASQTLTIPAGVLAGDVLLVVVNAFDGAAAATISLTSTGTAPVAIKQNQVNFGGLNANGGTWYIIAGASEAGKVLTAAISTGTAFWSLALASYTGASNSAPIDVSGGTTSAGTGATLTYPAETTGAGGDWAVYLAAADPNSTYTEPSGPTSRIKHVAASGIVADIVDSNGSVGGSGTSIGGATIGNGSGGAGSCWYGGFTIGLAPAGGTPHTATASLTVTPSFASTKGLGLVQAMTVRPVFTVKKGLGKVPKLAVVPVLAVTRKAVYGRGPSLTVVPVFRAVPAGGVPKGGSVDRHHHRAAK